MKRIVGKIAGFHGVKGEIKVYPLVDDVRVFEQFEAVAIIPLNDNNLRSVNLNNLNINEFEIEQIRYHKSFVLLKLFDYDDLNSVKHLQGFICAELEEELGPKEFYMQDLLGLQVYDTLTETKIGIVKFCSKLSIIVRLNENFKVKNDLIVPFVEEYIVDVDMQNRIVKIVLTEDLLSLTG